MVSSKISDLVQTGSFQTPRLPLKPQYSEHIEVKDYIMPSRSYRNVSKKFHQRTNFKDGNILGLTTSLFHIQAFIHFDKNLLDIPFILSLFSVWFTSVLKSGNFILN